MAAAAPVDTAAAAAAGDSRELMVPPPRPGVLHMCVEYPGFVADEERVLETLGGTAGIARQLQVGGAGRAAGMLTELRVRVVSSALAWAACCVHNNQMHACAQPCISV